MQQTLLPPERIIRFRNGGREKERRKASLSLPNPPFLLFSTPDSTAKTVFKCNRCTNSIQSSRYAVCYDTSDLSDVFPGGQYTASTSLNESVVALLSPNESDVS